MRQANADGSIDLDVGDHLIELSASTVDELYHTGAYWRYDLSWEPL